MIQGQRSTGLLLLGLFITICSVLLYEAGIISNRAHELYAQVEGKPLQLKKGTETATIAVGDWVVTVDALDEKSIDGGRFLGIRGENIILEKPVRKTRKNKNPLPEQLEVSLANVSVLYHGEAKRVGYYSMKGARVGGLAACAVGVVMGVACALDPYEVSPIEGLFMGSFFGTIIMSIYTVPGGTVLGFLTGLVKNGQAVEYPLMGVDAWEIVKE